MRDETDFGQTAEKNKRQQEPVSHNKKTNVTELNHNGI
jgi:hypothetical protein